MGAEFLEGTCRFNNALLGECGASWRLDGSVRSVCLCESLCLCGEFSPGILIKETLRKTYNPGPQAQTVDAIRSRSISDLTLSIDALAASYPSLTSSSARRV